MVEELKLAIKIDDATIEQSLLKQFANAQKMADKVVLDFKNVNFDDKQIEAKFKEMQKKAGQNPIDLTIGGNTLDMLGQIDKRLTEIFSIGKGKSFIDSSSIATDIGKIENKINELNKKYEESQKKLSSIGSGGISAKDVNLVDNEEFKKLSQEVSELKNQFDDLKTHMQLLDDYTVPTDRFFELQSQVETTTVKVSDLVEEFAKLSNAQKALSSTPQESNISSGDFKEQSTEIDLYHNLEKRKVTYDEIIDRIQTIVSLKEKEKSLSKTSDDTKLYQNLYDENDINWAGDTEGTINRISDRLKEIYIKYNGKISLINENDIQEAAYLLDILKGAGESPNLNKSQEKFYQNKKFSNDSLFDNIHVDSQKTGEIDKINTELSETYRWFNQLEGVSLNENIANEIKSLISDMQIGGKTANEYANDLLKIFNIEVGSNSAIEQQNKLQSELKETESQAEKTAMAVKEISSTTSQDQRKDAFPPTEATASVKKVADGFKEVKQKTEKATESAKDYVRTISQVGEWNVDSKVSVVKEKNDGQLETWSYDAKRGKKDIAYDKDGNINYGDPIITTISNYKQLEQTIVKADDKLRDLKKTLKDTKEINPNASTENIEKQIEYQEEYISLLEKTVKTISKSDEYFLNGQQIIDTRKKAATEYDLKQGTKSDIANAKQSAKANEQAIRQEQKLTDELRKQEEQARKTALSYTESASKKLSDAISKYSYGDSSDATAMMKQMNRGLSNFGDLSNIKSDIKNFDSIVDAIITDLKHSHEESLFALNNEIKVEETMQKQKDAFNKSNLNAIDMEIQKREEEAKAFSNSLKAQMESQQQAESQMSKLESTLSKYQAKKDSYDATIARLKDGGWTSDEYLKNVQAVKDAVKKYEDLLSDIKAKGGIASEEDVQKLKEYEGEIKKTISTVTNMSASEKGYNFVSGQKELDKIHKLLEENSRMSSEAKNKIKAYYAEIESGNPSMSLDRIHGEIMKIYNAEVEAGRAGKSMWSIIKSSGLHQIAAQMAGMFGVYDVINLGKQAFSTVKELDYALVDLKKTTAMNSSELEQFYYDSNDVAKQMGVTTKEIIDQASSWSRLGYNSKQAATEMAKLSSQFALISPGMDTTTSQEGLVSIMKAWNIGYQDVKSQIMDDINALGNAMAEDNQDIVEGMERSAAALAAVGTSTKDAFALFSGIQEVLQNSEKSGTSLRSVALRLRSFDETTGEYSEDLANITGELADLTKTAEHAQGVSVFKPGSTTEFKSLVDYFREIADIWDEMSQKQQNDFLLKAFGRTQAQAGAALIQNFKGVEKALDVMDNAAGSSDKEMETAKQSITYKLNELKQTWVGTVQDIANRDDLGKIVDGLIDLSSAIGFVIDKLGLVGTVGLFGGAGTGIFKFIKNFDWVFKPYTKTLSNSF